MEMNYTGLHIRKPAGPSDAYDGGLKLERDGRHLSGGTPGNVNCQLFAYTTAGADQRAFEWNALFLLENYAREGENCASYHQANKWSLGGSWAACFEVCDTTGTRGPMRASEHDVWCTGPELGPDSPRIGADIVVGDSMTKRGMVSTGVADATVGFRVDKAGESPWARWLIGGIIRAFKQCGLFIDGEAPQALAINGKYVVGVNLAGASCTTAIRLGQGQRITFDQWDGVGVSFRNGMLAFDDNGGAPLMELHTATGNLYVKGSVYTAGRRL